MIKKRVSTGPGLQLSQVAPHAHASFISCRWQGHDHGRCTLYSRTQLSRRLLESRVTSHESRVTSHEMCHSTVTPFAGNFRAWFPGTVPWLYLRVISGLFFIWSLLLTHWIRFNLDLFLAAYWPFRVCFWIWVFAPSLWSIPSCLLTFYYWPAYWPRSIPSCLLTFSSVSDPFFWRFIFAMSAASLTCVTRVCVCVLRVCMHMYVHLCIMRDLFFWRFIFTMSAASLQDVCVCITCVCVCVYIYIYIYIHIYCICATHTYTSHTHTHTCTYIYTSSFPHTHTQTCIHILICSISASSLITIHYARIHEPICIYIHSHTHTYSLSHHHPEA
jgi:hypothetical protein